MLLVTPSLPEVSSGGPETLPRPRGTASAGDSRQSGRSVLPEGTLAGLSIVLPCFNEVGNLAETVERAIAASTRVSRRHELIIVDDGSRDGTGDLAAELAEVHRSVRLVLHVTNRGYGAAVRTGIRAARMPYVLITDADLQFDLDELESFVPELEHADVVVGYRLRRNDPPFRRGAAAAWNALVCSLYSMQLRDVDCAFKLFPRDLIQGLDLGATGAMFSTELLVKTLGAGASIAELGVHHYPRRSGKPSGGSPRVVARAFRELLRLHGSLHRLAPRGS
jgi:glycosyl transferase family 2